MSNESAIGATGTKLCPRCNLDLQLSEFGISRARKDGLNIYCKGCNRDRTNASRQAARERRARLKDIRDGSGADVAEHYVTPRQPVSGNAARTFLGRSLNMLSPAERIKEAIRLGPKTQKQLLEETKLSKDEIGEALADLILWTHEIRTMVSGETRLYFLNEQARPNSAESQSELDPSRFDTDLSSFSSLHLLMPGQVKSKQDHKENAWIAA
jgi:hypothetical protein